MNPINEQDLHLIINQSLLWDVVTEGKVNDQPLPLHPAYKINLRKWKRKKKQFSLALHQQKGLRQKPGERFQGQQHNFAFTFAWSFGILASESNIAPFLFVCLFDVTAIQYKTFHTWHQLNSVRPSPSKMAFLKRDFLLAKNTLTPNLFTVGCLCCFSRDLEAV